MARLRLLFLSLSIFLCIPIVSTAQSLQPAAPVFILRDNRVLRLDAQTGQQMTALELPLPVQNDTSNAANVEAPHIFLARIDAAAQFVYLIEASGRDQRLLPTATNLVQIDLKTGKRAIIFDHSGIFKFSISPDQQHMVISYYEAAYAWSVQQSCILDLATLDCPPITLLIGESIAYWLDNESYVITTAEDIRIRLVNAATGTDTPLALPPEWYIYSAVPIPDTRTLLISATKQTDATAVYSASSFLTYNIDSDELTELAYRAPNLTDYPLVTRWYFSPDGRYLFYGGGAKMALIEFSTGRLIGEVKSAINTGWQDNTTLIVQGSRDGNTIEILKINPADGLVTQLATGEAANGFLLMP